METIKKKSPLIPHPSCYLPKLKKIYEQSKPSNKPSLINLNKKYYNKDSITWFRHKYNKTQIINSINDLIVTPRPASSSSSSSSKSRSKLKPKLTLSQTDVNKINRSFSFQKDKLLINIKHLFTSDKLKTILKLKDLFLDFDFDKNKIMELEEIQTMFTMNNIKVNKSDLISLFFKDHMTVTNTRHDRIKEKKLFLNFYQFIQFCLGQSNEFRNFMKKLKEENKKDNDFLPMNFNALLNYFIDKGEERKCLNKINNAMTSMDKAIDSDDYLITKQNEDINFKAIMKEFECLFVLTKNRGETNNNKKRIRSPINKKKKQSIRESSFENYSERKKETDKIRTVLTLPKRTSLQFRAPKNNEKRCFSSQNVLLC